MTSKPVKASAVTDARTPRLVFQPSIYQGFQQGIDLLVEAIKPTLGPLPRSVAVEKISRTQPPEILDKGALIARRIFALQHRDADMGAMLLRQMLWQQYDSVGDGTATAGVLFQSLFRDGVRYITAGGNAMRVRSYLLNALAEAKRCLGGMTTSITGQETIRRLARTHGADEPAAELLGEAFDVLGEYGRIDIHRGYSRVLEREYVHGMIWEGGVHAPELILDAVSRRSALEDPAIFLSDLDFEDPRQVVPLIESASRRARALVVVASRLSPRALGLFTHVNKTPERFAMFAVKLPADRAAGAQMLEELAIITGARPFVQAAGEQPQQVRPDDLGLAKQVWANQEVFCIVEDADGGQARSRFLDTLLRRHQQTADPEARRALRERIGRLMGASAALLVGGATTSEIDARRDSIKAVVATVRSGLMDGVVPGGGIALLNCRGELLRTASAAQDLDERAAYRMLAQALELPARQIMVNAGLEAGELLGRLKAAPIDHGVDVRSGQVISMTEAGILDPAAVVASALEQAVRSAALALTIDVLVQHRHPEQSAHP
ncbi:MAG: hypothetical protein JNL42_10340 [Anaerolineae bacterium]|nr:hypothetical protein [Anaerolineae bacterium]